MSTITTERSASVVVPRARTEARPLRVAGLILAHAVVLNAALFAAVALRASRGENYHAYFRTAPIMTAIFLATLGYHLVFERDPYATYTECLRVVARAMLAGGIASIAAIFIVGARSYPRSAILLSIPIALLGAYGVEATRLAYRLRNRPARRAVVVGPEAAGEPIIQHFEAFPSGTLAVVDRVETTHLLDRLLDPAPLPYDVMLIPGPVQLGQTPTRLLLAARRRGMRIFMLAGESGAFLGLSELHDVGGLPWHELRVESLPAPRRAAKRILDVALALLAAPFALIAGLVIAVVIRAESRGPVLHRQVRSGLAGNTFSMVKFRTMADGAEPNGARAADSDDERVTRVGRFLRRHRLDELPQLWNVLLGDMSLVGPRPERPELVEMFQRSLPDYADRHSIRPGITGLAQVLGAYDTPAEHKVRYDLLYVANWSIWLDVQILLKTVVVMVRGTGAR